MDKSLPTTDYWLFYYDLMFMSVVLEWLGAIFNIILYIT